VEIHSSPLFKMLYYPRSMKISDLTSEDISFAVSKFIHLAIRKGYDAQADEQASKSRAAEF
jgi:hypothetical protein